MKEYSIWGKSPKNPIHENLLVSQYKDNFIHDLKIAKKIEKALIEKHGCFETRIHELDLENIDINKLFISTINK